MLCFPQLLTGAVSQFPGRKGIERRTVVNEAEDGRTVKLGDAAASELEWVLELKGLTDSEWEAIEELFEAVEGRLGTFTFLDPFGNLLSWSENLSAAVWERTEGVSIAKGHEDPLGGFGACAAMNVGAGEGKVSQVLAAPGWYGYCLSVYARSAEPGAVKLFVSTPSAAVEKAAAIGPAWRRVELSANLHAADETVEFGARIAPGSAVELFGFQAEPQVGPSKYKKTTSRGGVHCAWFAQDELVRIAHGVNDNACTVRIRVRQ
ncbi:MAG: phage head spike fiber domain-containing protein [Rhodospirillales bacterium]